MYVKQTHFTTYKLAMKLVIVVLLFILMTSTAFGRAAFRVEGNNVIIDLEGVTVKSKKLTVEIWSTRTVRIRTTMNDSFSDAPLIYGERNNATVKFKAAYAQANIEITTADIQINVAEDGIVRILNGVGSKMLLESNRVFEPSLVEENAFRINQKFNVNRGEHIYGFGQEDQQNRFNLRDQSFEVKQDQSAVASPIFISEKGFALIWNNFSATQFADEPGALSLSSDVADEIDYFIISGPEWATIISEIRSITGTAPMLPKWAFGFHLNPFAYKSGNDLIAAVQKYRLLGIPVEEKIVDHQLYVEEKELTAKKVTGRLQNIYAFSELKEKYGNALTDSERVVIPTHINIPGIQKYGTFSVAGDISQCWESLKCQVCAGINSSITGQPYWSTTLGGQHTDKGCTSESLKELMVRWTQFAAFTPIFQGSPLGNEIWNTGDANDPNFMAIKKAIELRYRLLPYIYSTAYHASANNDNIIRSLNYDFRNDEKLHSNHQQYLFGPSMMVSPVVEKTNQMNVTLPANMNWIDFWSGKTYQGGTDLKANVTLDHIPVYIKQGSIIPMGTVGGNSTDQIDAPMEIRIYGGADAEFVLYEDENEGMGYKNGAFSKITFSYSAKGNALTIDSPEGTYPGMITQRIFNVVLVSETDGIGLDPSVSSKEIAYTGKKVKVKFED